MNRRPIVTLTDLDWNRVVADVTFPKTIRDVMNFTNPASGSTLIDPLTYRNECCRHFDDGVCNLQDPCTIRDCVGLVCGALCRG